MAEKSRRRDILKDVGKDLLQRTKRKAKKLVQGEQSRPIIVPPAASTFPSPTASAGEDEESDYASPPRRSTRKTAVAGRGTSVVACDGADRDAQAGGAGVGAQEERQPERPRTPPRRTRRVELLLGTAGGQKSAASSTSSIAAAEARDSPSLAFPAPPAGRQRNRRSSFSPAGSDKRSSSATKWPSALFSRQASHLESLMSAVAEDNHDLGEEVAEMGAETRIVRDEIRIVRDELGDVKALLAEVVQLRGELAALKTTASDGEKETEERLARLIRAGVQEAVAAARGGESAGGAGAAPWAAKPGSPAKLEPETLLEEGEETHGLEECTRSGSPRRFRQPAPVTNSPRQRMLDHYWKRSGSECWASSSSAISGFNIDSSGRLRSLSSFPPAAKAEKQDATSSPGGDSSPKSPPAAGSAEERSEEGRAAEGAEGAEAGLPGENALVLGNMMNEYLDKMKHEALEKLMTESEVEAFERMVNEVQIWRTVFTRANLRRVIFGLNEDRTVYLECSLEQHMLEACLADFLMRAFLFGFCAVAFFAGYFVGGSLFAVLALGTCLTGGTSAILFKKTIHRHIQGHVERYFPAFELGLKTVKVQRKYKAAKDGTKAAISGALGGVKRLFLSGAIHSAERRQQRQVADQQEHGSAVNDGSAAGDNGASAHRRRE